MNNWEMEPTVSRMVHYVPSADETPDHVFPQQQFSVCHAAVVTAVEEGKVSLTVLGPAGIYRLDDVEHDEILQESRGLHDHNAKTWHWPERVNTGFSMRVTGVTDERPPAGSG
jgi:hypothetical protein